MSRINDTSIVLVKKQSKKGLYYLVLLVAGFEFMATLQNRHLEGVLLDDDVNEFKVQMDVNKKLNKDGVEYETRDLFIRYKNIPLSVYCSNRENTALLRTFLNNIKVDETK